MTTRTFVFGKIIVWVSHAVGHVILCKPKEGGGFRLETQLSSFDIYKHNGDDEPEDYV
jgi:hypothetical protein